MRITLPSADLVPAPSEPAPLVPDDRCSAFTVDEPGVGPWDTRYLAVLTNRECLAVVELIPPPTKEHGRSVVEDLNEGWIKWSLGYVEHFRRHLPPLVTPVRRLPSDIPHRR